MNSMKRMLLFVLFVSLACSFVWAAGGKAEIEEMVQEVQKLEFSVFIRHGKLWVPPEEDVVAAAIRRKGWEITITDLYQEAAGDSNWSERLMMFIATDTLPDVFHLPAAGVDTIAEYAELFYDMEPYLTDPAKTPNLHKYIDDRIIDSMRLLETGQVIYWPGGVYPNFRDPAIQKKFPEIFLDRHQDNIWAISIREDILKELGYKFKPIEEIEKEMERNNRRLTYDDIKIEPEIKTFPDLEEFFRKVKDLNMVSPDGIPVIPYGGSHVTFQLGGAIGFYFFRWLEGEAVSGYGNPYAKELFNMLNHWAREGWLDRDCFLYMNQLEKLTDKVATGRYAAWCQGFLPNVEVAEERLAESIPGARTRCISIPRWREDIPQYLSSIRTGVSGATLINKKYKDIDNLVRYMDWHYSDEATEIRHWGDEEGGLWEIREGKKVFKDEELWNALRKAYWEATTSDGRGASYYGLASYSPYCFVGGSVIDPVDYWKRNYPGKYDTRPEMRRVATIPISCNDGTSGYPRGEAAAKVNNFLWSESWDYHGKLALAETDARFEEIWDEAYKRFMEMTDYERAIEDMTRTVFKEFAGK